MDHVTLAGDLFLEGFNCAQAVAVAFCDVTALTEIQAARMASAFGGGMGRMREVCGAVSGMFMVLGLLYGYDDPKADDTKKKLYTDVQALAGQFKAEAGSIICRDILKNPPSDPSPSPRTAEYYAMRPCERMVYNAAAFALCHLHDFKKNRYKNIDFSERPCIMGLVRINPKNKIKN